MNRITKMGLIAGGMVGIILLLFTEELGLSVIMFIAMQVLFQAVRIARNNIK